MKLTNFRKLRIAVGNISWNYIANEMRRLTELLDGEGMPFDPKDVSITEEGIYYISPKSGMATKVALYTPKQAVPHKLYKQRIPGGKGFSDFEVIDHFHPYHLTKCNTLSHEEFRGWKQEYKMVQRSDNLFPYWLSISDPRKKSEEMLERFLPEQSLKCCPDCLVKMNSLLGVEAAFSERNFLPSYFFDAGLDSTWFKPIAHSRKRGVMAEIHPRDWKDISKRRMVQAAFTCEHCHVDLSEPKLQNFLYIQHSDHLGSKIGYVKLSCLCLACLAECPDHEKIKQTPKYKLFVKHREELF